MGFSLVPKICLPCVCHVSASCPPCVHLASALSPLWPRLQTLSAMRPLCVQPCVHFGCASKPCLPCVSLAFCPPCVNSNLDLASGLCPLLACRGAGPWHHQTKLFGSPNSAFASAPYALKTVWGLRSVLV